VAVGFAGHPGMAVPRDDCKAIVTVLGREC
jgi:hypothetical protein